MKLGNYKDNDVELCRTTNSRVSTHTAEALLEQHIPFTKNSKKIPFFKRETYQGADTLWVITINPRRYGQARRDRWYGSCIPGASGVIQLLE